MYNPYPDDYPLREELIEYSEQVIKLEIVAGKKHIQACLRFLFDLEREGAEGFPFYFDELAALRFFNWMRLFKHREGVLQGQRIEPHIIQKFVFGNIYGWLHVKTGYRRFNKAYWQVGRKNAKSQSLATVGTYEQMALDDGASEVYCAGTKTDQARIVWKAAKAMLEGCEELQGKFKIAYNTILHEKTGSEMRALSKEDRKKGDGFNPQCGIIDEYHAHDTDEMYDILDSGMVARPQPLIMVITTAGFELNNPCYAVEYKYISQIIDPENPIENEKYFVMVNELDMDENGDLTDDIKDESVWPKANPIVCSYPEGVEALRGRLQAALDAPEKMTKFLTKSMNVWVNAREKGYMNLETWNRCGGELPDLKGMACWVGVDLSAKMDLTSISFNFPLADGKYAIFSHSFMPEETLHAKMKTDKVTYDLWVRQGWLTMTPGAVVDYKFVQKYIIETAKERGWIIQEICCDPWNATQFMNDMQAEGYVCVEVIQGYRTLSEPTKDVRELTAEGRLIHDGNPVMAWSMGNAVTVEDPAGNIKLDKSKSTQRIDSTASLINSHVRARLHEHINEKSVYEDRGLITL